MSILGIDVSAWNGNIDWSKVKGAGCQFAILKILKKDLGFDKQFKANLSGVRAQGIPFGVYRYVYESTPATAEKAAQAVVDALTKYDVPAGTFVWWDVEDSAIQPANKAEKEQLEESILAAEKVVKNAGYRFGIYCGLWWYNSVLSTARLTCPFWVARYPCRKDISYRAKPEPKYRPDIRHTLWGWQYTSLGTMPGCTGNNGHVDLNEIYGDFDPAPQKPMLRRGAKGEDVRHLQRLLNLYGAKLAVDGSFGPLTDQAVRDFQQAKGLVVDGIVGPKTWGALTAE